MRNDDRLPLGICGLPTIRNRGALTWSPNGLAAIGSGTDIVILDTKDLNVVANLSSVHKSSVIQLLWNPFGRLILPEKPDKQPPDLISIDSSSLLVTWDIEKGQSISSFSHPDSKVLLDLKWANGFDTSQKSKLFLLYTANLIVVLDVMTLTYQNIYITDSGIVSMDYLFFSFDIDPFCSSYATTLGLLTDNSVSFVQNWDPLKIKQEKVVISSKMVLNTKGASPNPSPISADFHTKRHNSTTGIRKLVSDIVGVDNPLIPGQTPKPDGTLLYHHNLKDHLVVSNSSHVLLINTHFRVILCTFSIDKGTSPLVQVIPTKQRPALVTLHENGTIYLRKYIISGTHTFSVSLETICSSDQPRFSTKKSEILGIMLDPKVENAVILYLNDGRYIQYDIVGPSKLKGALVFQHKAKQHLITPITPSVSFDLLSGDNVKEDRSFGLLGIKDSKPDLSQSQTSQIPLVELLQNILEPETENCLQIKLKRASPLIGALTALRSCPKNQIIVAGTSQGFILVFKIIGEISEVHNPICELKKRFSVHSNTPVCGIEFISDDEIISYANLSFSANPKCEMVLTQLWTGATKSLKQDDPFHIGFIRASPLKQYFILAYKNGMAPCELWDISRRQLIKTLPSKLPSITCATWKHSSEASKDETFFMTDLGTFLFTFRVEGNRFASATCVKLDTAGNTGGVPVSLISKGKLVFRGDSSGTLVIYDTEKKTASAGVTIGRGPLLKIEAGEGVFDGLFIAQFNEQVELWDLLEVKKIRTLHNGRNLKVADICWMSGYLATIPRNSGGIKFLSLDEPQKMMASRPKTTPLNTSFLSPDQKCQRFLALLNLTPNSGEAFYNLFEEIGAYEESKLWCVLLTSLKMAQPGWNSKEGGFNLFSENKSYKDIVVKLAQSVWFCDMGKREEVAKVLLWAGESEKAAEILLDTEPSGSLQYISNGMKAGLCVGSTQLPEATKAVLKIIATNLIACGEIDEGLEMLCLLSKHSEAVKYLESSNDWSRAILLSKTSLTEKQSNETLAKYGQFLNSHRHIIRSACIYASIGKYDRTIEVLFGGRKRHLSYLFLIFCDKHKIELPNLTNHVRLAIRLDFARFIFDCGLMKEALSFCDTIGEEAKDLKSELEILSS